jgi:hypothetical protein
METAPAPDADDAALREARVRSGESVRELMRAILLDAVLCLRSPSGPFRQRERLVREARAWMTSPVRTWPFSFENVCEVLGLSASYLRTLLLGESAPAGAVEDIVRRLSKLRMRGNHNTHVVRPRADARRKKRDLRAE